VAIFGVFIAGETKDDYYQPLEKAELVRSGADVTILCYSRMRYVVMQAVQQLEGMGYDPEVRPDFSIHGHLHPGSPIL
jgi:pyruvate/2-oxoglutarate/acetoin dehydrogenase E1 component